MSPFKNESQRKKFAQLVKEGKITQATFDAWNEETPDRKLPERAKPQRIKKGKKIRVIR